MKVSESLKTTNKKAVLFNMEDRLDDKLDNVTSMMSKLTAQGNTQDIQFKPKIYKGKKRGQTKHNYNQGNYQEQK